MCVLVCSQITFCLDLPSYRSLFPYDASLKGIAQHDETIANTLDSYLTGLVECTDLTHYTLVTLSL